jgi:hypothetical protein
MIVFAFVLGCSHVALPDDVAIDFDCGAEGGDEGVAPTFAEVQALFVRRYAAGSACHGEGARAGLALVGGSVYDDLVGHPSIGFGALPRVDPGHPERSFLWLKLDGCFAELPGCAGNDACGTRMPTLSPISEGFELSEATVVREWIAAGAQR